MSNSAQGPRPSLRGAIDPFHVMEVMKAAAERAATGAEVLHLEVGQPSTPAPQTALAAVTSALHSGTLGYTDALGTSELRAGIARHYRDYYGVAVPPERIVVTMGASGAFVLAFLAAFDSGARVALTEPGYPAYRNILQALGIEPVNIPVGAAERYQLGPTQLDQVGGRLDGVLVASPANPTGTMIAPATMRALYDDCRARGRWLIVDEIYHGITYGGRAETVLALGDEAIVVNSFSKYFSMTGWRVGWLVLPEPLIRPVECLAQNMFISPPAVSQVAALGALSAYAECDRNVARYAANRAILLDGLKAAGLTRLAPADGAFYIYADISDFSDDADAFCRRLLAETGIAATPGIDFDTRRGKQFMRFSFAGSEATMRETVKRLKDFTARLNGPI